MGDAIDRRVVLRGGLAALAGAWLAGGFPARVLAGAPAPAPKGRARSVVQIWLWGGPPHLDTFDPKPDAGRDYAGPLSRPLETNVRGIRISELLPTLATQADKFSLIRSMTHGNFGHETAAYVTQTGRSPGEGLAYPGAGSVVSWCRTRPGGYRGRIPPYVVLTEPQGRFDEAGFLGSRHRPFATGGDPSQPRFAVEGIVATGVSDAEQRARRDLLERLDALEHAAPDDPAVRAAVRAQDAAYEMVLGDGARTFDLAAESDALRDRYGRGKFGQSCLMARRLVEAGVPYVTVNDPGWDTHKDNFGAMRRKLPAFDRGVAALLEDLASRGLLETTLVWCGGEFGRTPRVQWEEPWSGGRGHWGNAFSVLVAGGGFRGGRVLGATDAKGEEVTDRPVHPRDLLRTMYGLLGIDPDVRLPAGDGTHVGALPSVAGGPARDPLEELL